MFTLILTAALGLPGLSHGIVPGMTSAQVEAKLGEGSACTIGLGQFGHYWSSCYRHARLVVQYEHDRAQRVERLMP